MHVFEYYLPVLQNRASRQCFSFVDILSGKIGENDALYSVGRVFDRVLV